MKKLGLIFMMAFISFLLLPLQVLAVDFSINKTQIDAYLQVNGNVLVTEFHTYEFDGDFNGVTRSIIPKDGTSITDFKATENNTALEVEQDDELFKIYRSGSDETITIELSYVINEGIEVYEDMGQFYWPFFDSNNESDYENLTITIHPPLPTNEVIAYGFDEAYKTETISGAGVVTFQIGHVDSGNNGDIRVAYNSSLFSEATTYNGTIRDELIRDEQELAEKQTNFLNRQEALGNAAPYVVSVFGLLLFSLLFYGWRRRQLTLLEADRLYHSNSIVPKDIMSMPAVIYYFRNYMVGYGDLLTAGMMDLVRKRNIKALGDETYSLTNTKTDHGHEAHLVELLFKKVGKDGIFSFDLLDEYTKSTLNQSNFYNDLVTYQKTIVEEINSNHLFDKHLKLRWSVGMISLLLIPCMIAFGIHHLFMWLSFCLILMIGLLLFSFVFHPRTAKGHVVKHRWKQFKKDFIESETSNWSQLSKDEKERVTIFLTGLNNQKLKEKNKSFIDHEATHNNDSYVTLFFLLALSTTANTGFNSATEVSAGSSSSSSFAGSGTGVGGGGGGSGAF